MYCLLFFFPDLGDEEEEGLDDIDEDELGEEEEVSSVEFKSQLNPTVVS